VSDLLHAVIAAGLTLERVVEWPYANGFKPFKNMRELEGRRYAVADGLPELPLMLGLSATRR
jgi:hypothetical protein